MRAHSSIIILVAALALGFGPGPGFSLPASYGSRTVVLEDGTVISGTLVGGNKRQISLSTAEGATVTIPTGLIKSLDGRTYAGGELIPGLAEVSPAPDSAARKNESVPPPSLKPGSSTEELLAGLRSPSREKRSVAAHEFGMRGQWVGEAVEAVEALCADTAEKSNIPPTKSGGDAPDHAALLAPGWEAARVLAGLGSQGYGELARLTGSTNAAVRERAAWGLGLTLNHEAVAVLMKLLDDGDPLVRAAAASALRYGEAVRALSARLSDGDARVRLSVVVSLGEIGDSASIGAIARALGDASVQVRYSAISALGRLRARTAVPALSAAVSDKAAEVRLAAVYALMRIRDTRAVPGFITALQDPDGSVRKVSAAALGELRDPRAIAPLRAALIDSPDSVKPTIRIALKQHVEVPLLIGALDDNDTTVRQNAEYLLWIITGKKLGYDKKAWADWYVNSNGAEEKSAPFTPAPTDSSFLSR